MKKILLFFAAMCCMMVANAQEFIVDGIKYNVTNKVFVEVDVVAYDYSGDIVIPEDVTYEDVRYRVTGIGEHAFNGCAYLTSIILPDELQRIGKSAFKGCTSLTSVYLPQSLVDIGMFAFEGCTGLKAITIENAKSNFRGGAFDDCTGLRAIYIISISEYDEINKKLISEAFGGIDHENVTLYLPHGVHSAIQLLFADVREYNLSELRESSLYEINAAKAGAVLTAEENITVNNCIEAIENATEETAMSIVIIEDAKNVALAIIIQATIRTLREAALAAIEEAMQGETGEYITGLIQQYLDIINSSTDANAIDNARNAAVSALNAAMPTYKGGKDDGMVEAFGALGKPQNGPVMIVTDQDGKEIILYSPKSVRYSKVNDK